VGNVAEYGQDVFRAGGTITSLGCNIIGRYGIGDGTTDHREYDWPADRGVVLPSERTPDMTGSSYTRSLLFGTNVLALNNSDPDETGAALGARQGITTLALVATTSAATNPALDKMPKDLAINAFSRFFGGFRYEDQRGVERDDYSDIGAYERGDGGNPPTPPGTKVIAYVKMGGIPNTMVKIGQTCSLTAMVYYRDESWSNAEAVTWESSRPTVARIDQYGNIVSLMQGTTTISVTTNGYTDEGRRAVDSAELTVSEEWSYINVDPDVWQKLGMFNDGMQQYAEQLHFVDTDPSIVKGASFAGAFKTAYGLDASPVTELVNANAVNFSSKPNYQGDKWVSAKPSISVSLGSLTPGAGSLLPLEFTYSLSWQEVSDILGRQVTKIDNPTELFGSLKLLFESVNGTTSPLVDADGEFGVAASQAVSSGALKLNNGNNGLTLTLDVLLGDVNNAADGIPQLIDGHLVAADGVADGTAAGSLWLLKRTGGGSGGGSSSSGGGGGGCDSGIGAATLVLLVLCLAWMRVARTKRDVHP
jgi:hypothetical protein